MTVASKEVLAWESTASLFHRPLSSILTVGGRSCSKGLASTSWVLGKPQALKDLYTVSARFLRHTSGPRVQSCAAGLYGWKAYRDEVTVATGPAL